MNNLPPKSIPEVRKQIVYQQNPDTGDGHHHLLKACANHII